MVMQENEKKTRKLFMNPFASERCDGCGTSYQAAMAACPRCGKENPHPERAFPFDEGKMMTPIVEIAIFLFGWLGLQLIAEIMANFFVTMMPDSPYLLLLVNYSSYLILTVGIVGITWKYLPNFFKKMWRKETLFGFLVVLGIYFFDYVWARFSSMFQVQENINQGTVTTLIKQSPILAIVFTGILAPFCEEMTYRAGLFTFAKRCNRYLAYFAVSVLFGIIHMHDFSSVNEWLNLPPYAFAGIAFAFGYEKWGLGASLLAHVTNNVLAILASMAV